MRLVTTVLNLFLLLLLSGCVRNQNEKPELVLFVAASLTDVVQEIGGEFSKQYEAVLVYNFASSGALAQQLIASPRADIFLSASQKWMDAVEQNEVLKAGSRETILRNRLVVIANQDSAFEIAQPEALAEVPFHFLSIGAPDSVPVGRYAKEWLESIPLAEHEHLWEQVESRVSPATDARAALIQVIGRTDTIGIVYETDFNSRATLVKQLWTVPVEEGPNIEYSGAVIQSTSDPDLALEFLHFIGSPKVQEIFVKHGFTPVEAR